MNFFVQYFFQYLTTMDWKESRTDGPGHRLAARRYGQASRVGIVSSRVDVSKKIAQVNLSRKFCFWTWYTLSKIKSILDFLSKKKRIKTNFFLFYIHKFWEHSFSKYVQIWRTIFWQQTIVRKNSLLKFYKYSKSLIHATENYLLN